MSRSSGHRARREEAKGQELADLKKKNQQLTREVTRLRKLVEKANQRVELAPPEEDVPETKVKPVEKTPECRSCGSKDLRSLKTPSGKIIQGCQACGNRM